MSRTFIIILVIVVALIVVLAARGGSPRVTQITRRHEKEDRKDGDDA